MNLVLCKSLSPLSSKHNQACPPQRFSKPWSRLSALLTVMLWLIRRWSLLICLNLFTVCSTKEKCIYYRANIHMHLWHTLARLLLLMSSTAHLYFIWVWYSRHTYTVMFPGYMLDWSELLSLAKLSRINEWCIYKALYCVFLYTQSALQSCGGGGGSLLNHHQCAASIWMLTTHQLQVERRESHWANQVYALPTHQIQVESRESHRANQVYALTTHQLQVESRESHRVNQVDGDY